MPNHKVNFNAPLLGIDRTYRQKISKNMQKLKNTANQLDQFDIYKTTHSTRAEYALF